MSFILRIKDFSFTDPNLPRLPQIYRSGLVAAFRPGNNEASLIDLSNNNVQLTKVGNPAFTEFGLQVASNNGYVLDAIETASFSLACCFRLEYEIGTVSGTAQAIGSRNGSANPVTGASIITGLFASPGAEDPGTRLQHSFSFGQSTGTPQNYRGTKIAQPAPDGPPYLSPWQFSICTYDAGTREYIIYEPAKSSIISGTASSLTVRTSNNWELGNSEASNDVLITMAEMDFYNKVLSPTEVQTVYDYSLPYLASKGIVPSATIVP